MLCVQGTKNLTGVPFENYFDPVRLLLPILPALEETKAQRD